MGEGTCQVPQAGVPQVYPACPTFGYSGVPVSSTPASYVPPTHIPVPACAFGPAATADSAECQRQVMAVQQQNFQIDNNANYAVDLANCLNTFPQPPDCYSRTFGLTPAGGYTSNAHPQGVT